MVWLGRKRHFHLNYGKLSNGVDEKSKEGVIRGKKTNLRDALSQSTARPTYIFEN